MKPNGSALLVVNKFIQLEKLADPLFTRCERIADNTQFKVIKLGLPLRIKTD